MTDDLCRYHACARELQRRPAVVAADVTDHDARVDAPTIEIIVEADRAPPDVLRTLADHDCAIHDVASRGHPTHTVIVAV